MTRAACTTQPQELLEYWLRKLDEAGEQRMDEHLFACAACTERLGAIVDLGAAIRRVFVHGNLNIVLPELLLQTGGEGRGAYACASTRSSPGGLHHHAPTISSSRICVHR